MFDGKEYIVRTEGDYIEKDQTIVVLRREGVNLVVRRG
jgi:membrane-bound ClpP family serine protease